MEALLVQGEGIQAGVIVAVGRGVEGPVRRAGQGHKGQAGGQRHRAHHFQRAHQQVHGVQAVLGAEDIHLPICVVIGHIQGVAGQSQRLDIGPLRQIIQGGHAEALILIDGEHMILHAVRRVNRIGGDGLRLGHLAGGKGDPGGVIGVVCINAAVRDLLLLAAAQLELIAGHVARIVHRDHADLPGLHVGGIYVNGRGGAKLRLIHALPGQDLRLPGIGHQNRRQIAVVLARYGQAGLSGDQILGIAGLGDLGGGIVYGHSRGPGCAGAQGPDDLPFRPIPVILRNRVHGYIDLRALGQRIAHRIRHAPVQRDGQRGIAPGSRAGVVIRAVLRALVYGPVNLPRLRIGDDHIQVAARVADQAGAGSIDLHTGVGADGSPIRQELRNRAIGVRGKIVGRGGIPGPHRQIVGIAAAHIGSRVFIHAVPQGNVLIKHGRIRPAAVVGQHREGHLRSLLQHGVCIDIALNIAAVGIVLLQIGPVRIAELDRDLYGNAGRAAVYQNHHGIHIGAVRLMVQTGQIELRIRRGDSAVMIEVVPGLQDALRQRLRAVGHLKQIHGVRLIDHAVGIHIIGVTHGIGNGELHRRIQRISRIRHVLLAVDLLHRHGVDGGVERIVGRIVLQIIQRKGKAVFAGALGIVAKVDLHFAVRCGLVVGQQKSGGSHGVIHICKAGSLLSGGILHAVLVLQRRRRRHQQRLRQSADRHALLLGQTGLVQILSDHRRHAGNTGGGHGGAGHRAIGAVGQRGPNVAAGRGDLRLQIQIPGNAPGGEVAGLITAGHVIDRGDLIFDHHLAAPQAVGILLGGIQNALRAAQGDEHCGLLVVIARKVHIQAVRLIIIIYDRSRSAGHRSIVRLYIERHAAAGYQNDLSRKVQALEILVRAVSPLPCLRVAQEYILVLRAGLIRRGIQGRKGMCAVRLGGIGIGGPDPIEHGHHAGQTGIVHGSDRKGIGEGAGRTHRIDHRVVGQLQLCTGIVVLRIAVLVAGGDGHNRIGIRQAVEQGIIGAVGMAGHGGTQREVHRIAAQEDRILQRRHVVGVIRAAVSAEDLKGQQLCIRRNANNAVLLPRGMQIAVRVLGPDIGVCRRNAGNVGPVIALGIVVMGDVQALVNVVKAIRHLRITIQLLGAHTGHLLSGVQLGQHLRHLVLGQQVIIGDGLIEPGSRALQAIQEGLLVKAGMVQIQTGIDHADPAAGAGVAVRPGTVRADHKPGRGGIRHSRVRLILVLDVDALHAGHSLNGLHLVVAHRRSYTIDPNGKLIANLQVSAQLLGQLRHLGQLLLLQLVAVGHGRLVFANVHGGKSLLGQGCLAETHDNAYRFLRCRLVKQRVCRLRNRGDQDRRLLQFQICAGACRRGPGHSAKEQAEHQRNGKEPL